MGDLFRSWQQDPLLRGVIRNSSYLFSSTSITAVLSLLQGIFAARLLGNENFGVLATIIAFVSSIHRLLSFRMNELVVKYLAESKNEQTAAIVKAAGLAEALTSLLAFLALVMLAPWAAQYLAKDPRTAPLFVFYGLVLFANLTYETALGVLQGSNRFSRQAQINLIQGILTAGLILTAFVMKGSLAQVLLAYLLGKAFAGLATTWLALRGCNHILGNGWWRVPLKTIEDWGKLRSFAISTNLHGTANLVFRDSEVLFISFLRSPTESGYFRIAQGVINLVMLPIEPFIAPTYAEISRAIAQKEWPATRRLLKRVSALAAAWTLPAGGFLALFGYWLIPWFYGAEYRPAYPAMLILLVGYGFASIFHWNRPLLLALGRPSFPLRVSTLTGLVKTLLTFLLLPVYGYLAEAAILSGYFLASIGVNVWRGLREVDSRLRSAGQGEASSQA
jgi:O-antigen/teichoic acid export membrane protein